MLIPDVLLDVNTYKATAQWLVSSGLKIAVIIVATFFFSAFSKKLIKRIVSKTSKINGYILKVNQKRQETLSRIFSSTANTLVWLVAVFMVLPELGINITALLAGVGVIGLALGMGARQLIQDYLNGIFILLDDQYRVGDSITVGGLEGEVVDISLRRTILKDKEGLVHFIPHSNVSITSKKLSQHAEPDRGNKESA